MNLDLYYVVRTYEHDVEKISYVSGPYGSYNDAWIARCENSAISSIYLEVVCYTQTVHMI